MEQGVHHDRALEIALGKPLEKNVETIQFNQANGRVLANPLSSHVDDPRFDNSAMDGFAVRASDCKEDPQYSQSSASVRRVVNTRLRSDPGRHAG